MSIKWTRKKQQQQHSNRMRIFAIIILCSFSSSFSHCVIVARFHLFWYIHIDRFDRMSFWFRCLGNQCVYITYIQYTHLLLYSKIVFLFPCVYTKCNDSIKLKLVLSFDSNENRRIFLPMSNIFVCFFIFYREKKEFVRHLI